MPGEDQERFEDYLELEHYIEELQAGHVAHPPTELTPSQASIYRMAALFRSASPEGAEPRPEFAAELRARLEQELEESAPTQKLPAMGKRKPKELPKRLNGVSRRNLLTSGAAVAASMVIGAGIGHIADQVTQGQPVLPKPTAPQGKGNPGSSDKFLTDEAVTTWHKVTAVAQLGKDAVPFSTNTVVGYVIRGDEDADPQDRGKIIAMSAACTHMGCIVQWSSSDRKYHCPCHMGLFTEYGKVDKSSTGPLYLYPLPRLETMVEDGYIFVKVPTRTKTASHSTGWNNAAAGD